MPPPPPTAVLPPAFISKKSRIIQQLSVPSTSYDDLSPKGSIDSGIRDLIDEINAFEGLVTTSSCAGRISVFLEGKKRGSDDVADGDDDGGREGTAAGVGGKGGGGRWLYVSHDAIVASDVLCDVDGEEFGLDGYGEGVLRSFMGKEESRLIHLKFEPMILHILTASLSQAQIVLSAALQAGFRESGALGLMGSSGGEGETPMVGIRSMGLAFESIIGIENGERMVAMIPREQLRFLLQVANQRFGENTKRIERFRALLKEGMEASKGVKKSEYGGDWEDVTARRERKREEGMRRREEVRRERESRRDGGVDVDTLELES